MKYKIKTDYQIYKGIRKGWGSVNPVSKIFNSNKTYNRLYQKQNLRKELRELDSE